MPAPSPVLPSASTAPRCQTAFNAAMPFSTTLRLALPLIDTTKPTPHEACSSSSRYRLFCVIHWRFWSCCFIQSGPKAVVFSYVMDHLLMRRRPNCPKPFNGGRQRGLLSLYSAAMAAEGCSSAMIALAVSCPSLMAQTTKEAPRTISPTA